MKKLLCVLLLLCLLVPAALAEETATLNWENVVPVLEAGNVTGQFYTFDEIAVKIWLPDGMEPTELTDEDREKGYIGYFMPEDQSAQMAVMYVNTNGASLDEYAQYLSSESDVAEIEKGTVNNFPCVSYKLPAQDSVCIAFTTEKGYILELSCAPMSNEGFAATAAIIVSSIQAAE